MECTSETQRAQKMGRKTNKLEISLRIYLRASASLRCNSLAGETQKSVCVNNRRWRRRKLKLPQSRPRRLDFCTDEADCPLQELGLIIVIVIMAIGLSILGYVAA